MTARELEAAVGGKYVYLPASVGDNVQLCKARYTVQVKQLPAHNRSIPVLDLFTSACFGWNLSVLYSYEVFWLRCVALSTIVVLF